MLGELLFILQNLAQQSPPQEACPPPSLSHSFPHWCCLPAPYFHLQGCTDHRGLPIVGLPPLLEGESRSSALGCPSTNAASHWEGQMMAVWFCYRIHMWSTAPKQHPNLKFPASASLPMHDLRQLTNSSRCPPRDSEPQFPHLQHTIAFLLECHKESMTPSSGSPQNRAWLITYTQ